MLPLLPKPLQCQYSVFDLPIDDGFVDVLRLSKSESTSRLGSV